MLEKKSKKKGKVFTFVGLGLLLLSVIVGGEYMGLFIVISIILLVIGICLWAKAGSENKQAAKSVEALKADGLYEQLQSEIACGRAKEYPALGMIISEDRVYLVGKTFTQFEISQLTNVYRSNIIDKKYNYDWQVIAMELADGSYATSKTVSRDRVPAEFDEALGRLKSMATMQFAG